MSFILRICKIKRKINFIVYKTVIIYPLHPNVHSPVKDTVIYLPNIVGI